MCQICVKECLQLSRQLPSSLGVYTLREHDHLLRRHTKLPSPCNVTHSTSQYGSEMCFCMNPRPQLCLSRTHVKFVWLSLSGHLTFSSRLNHYLHVTWVPACSWSYRLHKLIEKMLHEIMQKTAWIYVFLTPRGYVQLIINLSSSIYWVRHLTSSLSIPLLFFLGF